MRKIAALASLGILGLFSACETDVPASGAADASADSTAKPDSGSPDGSASDGSTADADASAFDASLPDPPPRTVLTIPGLADFDMTTKQLALRVGTELSTCSLPGCADRKTLLVTQAGKNFFSIAGDRVYYGAPAPGSIQDNVFSIAFDGTGVVNRTNEVVGGGPTISALNAESFAGGVTKVEQVVRWARSDEAGYRVLFQTTSGSSGNPDRVGRPTRNTHENFGSEVKYVPKQVAFGPGNPTLAVTPATMTTVGATLPLPARDPEAIAVTPRGASVRYPMVFILDERRLKACSTAVNCAEWIDLGELGTVFNVDGERLYVGDALGLGSCLLFEIATKGTCTLKTMVSGEPVQAPLYVTAKEIWYRSGDNIRAVDQTAGVVCAPGAYRPPGAVACVSCAAGQSPSANFAACVPCRRGTHADAPGSAVCSPCPDGQSTAAEGGTATSCVACPPGSISNAATKNLCEDPDHLRVFLTAEAHNGNFADDATLAGANVIEKADAFCMRSASLPATGTYKAMLVDGTNRTAAPAVDWVFQPNKGYFQVDGVTKIGTTTAAQIFDLATATLQKPWSSDPAHLDRFFWTGLGATDWRTGAETCAGWTNAVLPALGRHGKASATNGTAIGASSSANCALFRGLLCVEQ